MTGLLTTDGLLGKNEFKETGAPCQCRGIAGGADVEADWLLTVCLVFVFKWLISPPVLLLLATCLHLREANNTAASMIRREAGNTVEMQRRGGGDVGGAVNEDNTNRGKTYHHLDGESISCNAENPMRTKNVEVRLSASSRQVLSNNTGKKGVLEEAGGSATAKRTRVGTAGLPSRVETLQGGLQSDSQITCSMRQHSFDPSGSSGGNDGDDDNSRTVAEENDCWTIHVDDATGHKYQLNSTTGESAWYVEEVEADHTIGGSNAEDDEGAAENETANVSSQLSKALQQIGGDGAPTDFVSDSRGDWVEVCDHAGDVLGAAYAGRTVYYNRVTFETRWAKPPGWVKMPAQAIGGVHR